MTEHKMFTENVMWLFGAYLAGTVATYFLFLKQNFKNATEATIDALIEKGHSIIVIEHNLDLIKCADHIIDLGPEGGELGGRILAFGTPEEIVKNKESITAKYLKEKL